MESNIIGKVVDCYEITGILGQGGMGIVYKAKDTTLDRDVALKMMDTNLARDESFLKRFQSEAKALARLQNLNIVAVFALRQTELGFCIVMEFVNGNTLADRLREGGAMPLAKVLPIFRQLLSALDHAHEAGIVHRDIKPGNVMLTEQDVVKVTDFGLAKIQQKATSTMTMGMGGTLYYMSPEQIRGLANVDHRGDIYSLGMTLYEALAGKVPFTEIDSDFSIRQMIVEGKVPSPDTINPALPKGVVKVIMKSIANDPDRRYQSAGEMLKDLETAATSQTTRIPTDQKKESTPPSSGSNRLLIYSVSGIAGVAVLALLFFTFSGSDRTMVSIESQPVGSEIALNGNSVGVTPLSGHPLQPGLTTVRVSHSGYIPKDTNIILEEGQNLQFHFTLSKERGSTQTLTQSQSMGTLVLQVIPRGSISIDDGPMSQRSERAQTFEVPAGERTVRFEAPGYGSTTRKIGVGAGEQKKLTCYFEGYVSVGVSGDSKWGTIQVDGKNTETFAPQARFPVAAGQHRLLVTREGYETVGGAKEVTVKPGFDATVMHVVFDLKKR